MSATPSREMRRAVNEMWRKRLFAMAGLALFFAVPVLPILGPQIKGQAFAIGWALTSAMVGLSMNVLAGYAGQISLAQSVFYGTGAFALGNLAVRAGIPWALSLPLAGLITAFVALLIGFPALRIRGLHLAIATLGFQFVVQRVIFRAKSLTGGAAGIDVRRPQLFSKGFFDDDVHFLYLIMIVLVVLWVIDRNLTRSRGGRAFFAIRQDEQVAASFGIPVARYKLLAFAIAGFYAGIAGAMFGTLQGDVTNELFDYIFSFEFLVFAVLGGLGSRAGTAFGSAFPVLFRSLLERLRTAGTMLGGVLLVFTLLRYPGGIAGQAREIRHLFAAMWARGRARARGVTGVLMGVAFLVALLGALAIAVMVGIVVGIYANKGMLSVFGAAFHLGVVIAIVLGIGIVGVLFEVLAKVLFALTGGSERTQVHEIEETAMTTADRLAAYAGTSFKRPGTLGVYRGPLLEVQDLAIRFGGVRALDGVSLEVREGELIGIMGPNGSGKTTMLNCISGFLTPNEGSVRFRGQDLLTKPPHQRAALGLGRTFQNVGLVKQETVFDNLVIAQHLVCRYGPLEGLVRTGAVTSEERRLRARARAVVEMLGLEDIVKEQVRSLPHGRAKLVELGAALVTGPELLLLDEPAAGVSPAEADALGETLRQVCANFGVTILMIEHHVPLMLSTCDYIYVLNFGQLLTHGEPQEVAAHPDVIAAYLGSVGKEASLATSGGQ